jgi:hypothetical protein
LQQISPLEDIHAIVFNSSYITGLDATNANAYYIAAQQNLTLVFAERTNMLYRNIMKFIVSDLPAFDTNTLTALQSYEPPPYTSKTYIIKNPSGNTPVTVNYPPQLSMYQTVQASSLAAGTDAGGRYIPGADAFPIYPDSNDSYTANGVFYQYDGINNIYNCSSALAGPGVDVSQTCKSAFPDTNASTFDGAHFNGYSFTGGAPALMPTLELSYCNVPNSDNIHITSTNSALPNIALSQLQCGIWGGTSLANADYVGENQINYSFDLAYSYDPNISPLDGAFFLLGAENRDFTFYYDTRDFNPIASSTTVSPYFGVYNNVFSGRGQLQYANFNNSLVSGTQAELWNGGMSAGSAPHYLLMQVTLPNGVIAPFYVVTVRGVYDGIYNTIYPGAFAQAYCPQSIVKDFTTQPFQTGVSTQVSGCTQEQYGGFKIDTTDGNSYQVQLRSISSGRGATITFVP